MHLKIQNITDQIEESKKEILLIMFIYYNFYGIVKKRRKQIKGK